MVRNAGRDVRLRTEKTGRREVRNMARVALLKDEQAGLVRDRWMNHVNMDESGRY